MDGKWLFFQAAPAGMRRAIGPSVLKPVRCVFLLALCLAPAWPATLVRLTLPEMISKSTAIIHGKVTGSSTAFRGDVIYTHYQVKVLEQWKGATQSTFDVQVPGGAAKGFRQTYAGAPELTPGQEYVLFLWTSSKGYTFSLGFTQGIFNLHKNAQGSTQAVRAPTTETLLEPKTGRSLKDQPISMPLTQLISQITGGANQ
jgi:hypothetical protein